MTFADFANWIREGLGKLFLGEHYQLAPWERTPQENVIDNALQKVQEFRQRWEESQHYQFIEKNRQALARRGLDLRLYLLDQTPEGISVKYTYPGQSLFLFHNQPLPQQETVPEGSENRDLILYRPDQPRHSLAHDEFRRSDRQDDITSRLLRPYASLPPSQDERDYHQVLCSAFEPDHNWSVLKAVAMADDVTGLLAAIQSAGQEKPFIEAMLPELLWNVFRGHADRYNDRYRDVLDRPMVVDAGIRRDLLPYRSPQGGLNAP